MRMSNKGIPSLDHRVTLRAYSYTVNSMGVDVKTASDSLVWCGVFSVSMDEYYKAAQEGLNADLGIVIHSADDNRPEKAVLDSVTYDVYRRYERTDGYTELYLRRARQ